MKKVGFIGTGGISNVHLRFLHERDDVKIAALCDVNEENLDKRHQEYGGLKFTDFHEMLDAVPLDAVWLCTPPQIREEPLLACAEKDIPVMCEKPVERNSAEAERIAEKLGNHNQKVQVGYVFRSIPLVGELLKAKADDRVHLVHSFYGCNVSLTMGLKPWFYEKERSGGGLVDQATHNLDLLRMLLGEVTTVTGVTSNPVKSKETGYTIDEVIAVDFVFENKTVGSHIHTWVGDGWRNEITFIGEKRLYRLNLGRGSLTIETPAEEDHIIKPEQGPIHDHQNITFLKILNSGDWSKNPCDYMDGVKTLKLTEECDRAVSK